MGCLIKSDNMAFVYDSVYKVPKLTKDLLNDLVIEYHSRIYNKKYKKETTEDNNALFYTKDKNDIKYYWYNNMVFNLHRDVIDLEYNNIYGVDKYWICTDGCCNGYFDDLYDEMIVNCGIDKDREFFKTELKTIKQEECLIPYENVEIVVKKETQYQFIKLLCCIHSI